MVGENWSRVHPLTVTFAVGLAAMVALPEPGAGLTRRDGDGAPTVVCPAEVAIEAELSSDSLLLAGTDIEIVAAPGTINQQRTQGGDCRFDVHALPAFQWQIASRPSGSNASLSGGSTLSPTLKPDLPGAYRIRFTGCPSGCTVPSLGGGTLSVPAATRELTLQVSDHVAIAPETEPFVPPEPPAPRLRVESTGCPDIGTDVFNPAWVVVEPWHGVDEYQQVSGKVRVSKVSRKDNALNHDSHDHNAVLVVDPRSEGLMPAGQDDFEVEWEWAHYRDRFWPTRSDRLVARGYHIHDCAHGAKTEVHPPVLTAAQRARAVEIDPARGFGTDVWVPGVVTDLWIRNSAGEITGNCSITGLHNTPIWVPGLSSCLPSTEGFSNNPIKTVFTFDIHLPRDPREVIEPLKEAPPVPLYVDIDDIEQSGGPRPTVEQDTTHPNVLHVTVDLSSFNGAIYSRRIEAAWVLPSPDNWGLRRWRVRFNSLDVHDDADGDLRGDGDWRFWINLNNTDREWQQIFNCDGCVHGQEDFDGKPWETDSQLPERRFGKDLRLFPEQKIFVHSGGYEEDWIWNDATGYVTTSVPQRVASYSVHSRCTSSAKSGCGSYNLNFQVFGGDPVPATLTPEGEEILDGYTVTADDLVEGALPLPPLQPSFGLPSEYVLESGQEPVTLALGDYFPVQGPEPNGLADVEDEAFLQELQKAREMEPEAFEEWMKELREEADLALETLSSQDVLTSLANLKAVFPPEVWEEYFGDIDGLPVLP